MNGHSDLIGALRREGVDDVSDSTLTRALYSSDASLYRVIPQVVARPRHVDELAAIMGVARETGVPLTMRGAGTSIAGNAVGSGIVVDTSRHLHRIVSIDPEQRTAVVEPGVVHASLQAAAAGHGLRFGPDPSTHTRCTIGGMVGNNACGSRALAYGRTSDNVVALDVLHPSGYDDVPARLQALGGQHLGHIRTGFGRFSRQVSGYAMEHLLPENGGNVDRFLVGSEGTLAVVRHATVRLVPEPAATSLVVLGYPSMAEAADAVPAILACGSLVACEGLDARIVDIVRASRGRVPDLPRGAGWLLVESTGGSAGEAESAALRVVDAAQALDSLLVSAAAEAAALWRIREDGAGLAAISLDRPAYSGWEDAAVPPERLGAWLREFDGLLRDYGLDGVPYGHFGDGCVHVRIDFTFDGPGKKTFREFLVASATALAAHGGSLSGEHGDGRARSELLPLMYDAESLRLFAAVKAICDPDSILNPGVLVDPAPMDADLRPARPVNDLLLHRRSLAREVHRCTGVGKCVAAPSGAVMCPSWQATRDEKDSTRGRARVLQEALDGELVHGLADPAVGEALDLCLSCKGCASDCPTGVDMATYKSQALHQTYAGRRRPRTHYTLGRLPALVRRLGPLAPLFNALMSFGPTARVAKRVAGIDPRRSVPRLTMDRVVSTVLDQPDVWIWADTFTGHFLPQTARAAVRLLESAGLRVGVIEQDACCGLTWITTGQLDQAARIAARAVDALAPYVVSGVPVIGLEPSCLATLRSDLTDLDTRPEAAAVAAGVLTLAELLSRIDWTPPDLTGVEIVAQPHCHHASVMGWEADEQLLRRAGATVTRLGGCCGLAGNFGLEQGHYDVSVAVAETQLLPAVRAQPMAIVLADGLSCRHQLDDLAGVPAVHLAELLAGHLPGS
ncbi:MAG: FAD-binding oxidoreductase [Nocardioides sp.]|nr:FAD-binding oxidoreductase [Nocardioides sp.]